MTPVVYLQLQIVVPEANVEVPDAGVQLLRNGHSLGLNFGQGACVYGNRSGIGPAVVCSGNRQLVSLTAPLNRPIQSG